VLLAKYLEEELPHVALDDAALEAHLLCAALVQHAPRMGRHSASAIAALDASPLAARLADGTTQLVPLSRQQRQRERLGLVRPASVCDVDLGNPVCAKCVHPFAFLVQALVGTAVVVAELACEGFGVAIGGACKAVPVSLGNERHAVAVLVDGQVALVAEDDFVVLVRVAVLADEAFAVVFEGLVHLPFLCRPPLSTR